jgi:hypothetical protein
VNPCGTVVSGSKTLTATASSSGTIAGVQFKLDNANLGAEDATAPYSYAWNTTTVVNGCHTLTAVARDASGNLGTSAPLLVTINN